MKSQTKKIALTEIIILLVGVFAFVWLINGVPSVSASGGPSSSKPSCPGLEPYCYNPATQTCAGSFSQNDVNCPAPWCCSVQPKAIQTGGTSGGTTNSPLSPVEGMGFTVGGNVLSNYIGKFVVPQTAPETAKEIAAEKAAETPKVPQTTTNVQPNSPPSFWSNLGSTTADVAAAATFAYIGHLAFTAAAKGLKANQYWTNGLNAIGTGLGAGGGLALGMTLLPSSWLTTISAPFATLLGVSSALGLGIAVAAAVAITSWLFSSSTIEQGAVVYYCNQWQPVPGGQNCDLCNHQTVPCSLYQCKSLGQSCAFSQSNASNGGASFCYYQNPHDINPPIMTPNTNALTPGFIYQNSTAASPPDREVKIIYTNDQAGCVPAFSTVTFGVNTNEYAACKISFNRTDSYGNMATYIGGSGLNLNHTQVLKIPYINTSIGQSNVISAYVRCQDANGNADVGNFVFQMCVQKGPDLTPPVIDSTNILNNTALVSGVQNVSVNFNVNKPSYCRWSYDPGTEYDSMQNNMSCVNDTTQLNGVLDYTCAANLSLTSTTPGKKTYFYAKCRDMTPTQNTNTQDYVYALSSSQPLVIKSVSPNATTISNSGSITPVTITATTIGGVNNGNASCTYIDNNNPSAGGVPFANTPSYQSSTTVYDSTGAQSYNITCTDDAGNSDTKTINFNVNLDNTPPVVTRVYYNNGQMEITTNEQAMCEYMTGNNCDYYFGQGTNISSSNGGKIHEFPWNTATDLSVKCEDAYGNLPTAGTCSIVVRAYGNQSS